jgi:hypothetical protein
MKPKKIIISVFFTLLVGCATGPTDEEIMANNKLERERYAAWCATKGGIVHYTCKERAMAIITSNNRLDLAGGYCRLPEDAKRLDLLPENSCDFLNRSREDEIEERVRQLELRNIRNY